MSKKDKVKKQEVVGFLGVGLDNKDGHKRLTRTEHFFLLGGSQETHERMQNTAIRFAESLQRQGKALPETPVEEVVEILHDAMDD